MSTPTISSPSTTLRDGRCRGPSLRAAPRYWATLTRDPLAGFCALRADYGDTVRLPFTPRHAFYLLSRPEHAEHVLVSHQDRYVKAFTYQPLRAFLGDGLLTSEGDTWQRHRRLVQPVFTRRHVQGFASDIVAAAADRAATWAAQDDIDLAGEMRTLTMDAVGRVLFGTHLAEDAAQVGAAVTKLQDIAVLGAYLPGGSPQRTRALASALIPGLRRAAGTMDTLVESVIEQRLAHPHNAPTDLLDLLIGSTTDAHPLTPTELRSEVATLVLAGHETTANTLTWTFTLLSQFPAARHELHTELNEVLGGRAPEAADVEKLVWTNAIISEAMRLYPPAWTIERDATVDDKIGDVAIPAGATVVISPYLLHRDRQNWPNPEGFDPTRFLRKHIDRPKYAYLPFGGGRRICVGASFAQLEATLILATVASTYQLDLAPGTRVTPRAGVTLHPHGTIPTTITTRPARDH